MTQETMTINTETAATESNDLSAMTASQLYYFHTGFGVLLNRVARAVDLVFRPTGLHFAVNKRTELLVTDNSRQILVILGYDTDAFEAGFQDQDDLFEFFTTSTWITRELVFSDKRNEFALKADRKFQLYRDFEKWAPRAEFPTKAPDLQLVPEVLLLAGPEFTARFQEYQNGSRRRRECYVKLNRGKIKQLTGRRDERIAELLAFMRRPFQTATEWESRIAGLSMEQANEWILESHKNLTST